MKDKSFYDIHTHIIPEVDDGSQTLEESIEMLKLAYEEGIRTIIATPHFIRNKKWNRDKVLKMYNALVKEAKKISPDFILHLGNELYYSNGIVEELDAEQAFSLAESKYVLVEFSFSESFRNIKTGIQELILSGYRPILAHVERFENMHKIECVRELVEAGCYIQVNATSFMGSILNRQAKFCKKLMCSGYVHLIGSDCHNSKNRKPVMESTYRYLAKYFNEDSLNEIFYENPKKIIENIYI